MEEYQKVRKNYLFVHVPVVLIGGAVFWQPNLERMRFGRKSLSAINAKARSGTSWIFHQRGWRESTRSSLVSVPSATLRPMP